MRAVPTAEAEEAAAEAVAVAEAPRPDGGGGGPSRPPPSLELELEELALLERQERQAPAASSVEAKRAEAVRLACERGCTLQCLVRRRLAWWRRIGAPARVLRWLHEGVRCEWVDAPPAPFHHGVSLVAPEDRGWLRDEVRRCLATGAWSPARCRRWVSRCFVVTHNGKRRLVIDLRWLNEHMPRRPCRFESLARLRRMLRRGDWLFSIDLTDAYHHVGIHREDQCYFTFALDLGGPEPLYLCYSALSFGWSWSPYIFTAVMRPVVAYIRSPCSASRRVRFGVPQAVASAGEGPRTLPWLDDFLFMVGEQLGHAGAIEVGCASGCSQSWMV